MSDINNLVTAIKLATDYQINKKVLKEKILTDLHIPYNNGMFKVTPDLISFVAIWDQPILYLEDIYENPIEIKRDEFLELCKQQYSKVMNYWHNEYVNIKSQRKA